VTPDLVIQPNITILALWVSHRSFLLSFTKFGKAILDVTNRHIYKPFDSLLDATEGLRQKPCDLLLGVTKGLGYKPCDLLLGVTKGLGF